MKNLSWEKTRKTALQLTLPLLLQASTAPAQNWTLTTSGAQASEFTATNAKTNSEVRGTLTHLPSGFVKQTIDAASAATNLKKGDTRFGLDVPGMGLFSQGFTAEEPFSTSKLQTGTCPSAIWEGVFTFAAWDKKGGNNVSSTEQPALGIFTYDARTKTATIPMLYNLAELGPVPGFKPFSVSGECKDGKITFSGEGDRAGEILLTKNGGGIYFAATGKRMVIAPKTTLTSLAKLEGSYSVLSYTGFGTKDSALSTLTLSGKSFSGSKLFDVENGRPNRAEAWSLTDLKLNSPVPGVLAGKLNTGTHPPRNAACSVQAAQGNFLFCSAQSGKTGSEPLNFVMVYSSPVLAKNAGR